jgi:hypothetical protein
MTIKLKGSDGAWKNIASMHLKNSSGIWKSIFSAYLKVAGSWKQIFISTLTPSIANTVTISQSTDGITYAKTLTGTNYYWTDSTGITYKFEKSTDSGATWTQIASGTATNPSSGSSNTNTYLLQNNLTDVSPNASNIYRYVVTATNSVYSTATTSTSGNTTIYGPENITIVETSRSYNSVSINWTSTAAANASNYLVYYKLSTDSTFSFSSVTSGTTATISSLASNTAYNFKVIPITGINATYSGYQGNDSNTLSITTNTAPTPTKLTNPTISGTAPSGQFGTTLTPTVGTYTNYSSITTILVSYAAPYTAPTDGETTSGASNIFAAGTHVIDQNDATTPARVFYTRDAVLGLNGTTYYYYSTSNITAYVGTVTDDFNRATTGIGTSSSGYTYSSSGYGTWSTNGQVASTSTTVNFATAGSSYPLQTIELTGKTNLTASLKIPDGGGGPGLAFWVTSQGSWWAVAPSYYSATTSSSTCTGTTISTNAGGTGCGGCTVTSTAGSTTCTGTAISTNAGGTGCGGCSVTTGGGGLGCTGSTSGSSCPSTGVVASGARCSACSSSNPVVCNGASSNYANNTLSGACGGKCSCTGPFTTSYTCTGSGSGSTCPATGSTFGARCGACTLVVPGFYTWPTNAGSISTYYTCTVSTCPTVYAWNVYETQPTTYSCNTPVTGATTYSCNPIVTTSTTTYYSRIRILSTTGSPVYSVVSNADVNISSSTTAYDKIYYISAITSGDSITAKGYNISSTQIGSNVTYTRVPGSDLVKVATDGSSSAGIIYTPTDANSSTSFDDLSIS